MSTNFSPTPAELNLVTQIFTQHDSQKLGILTGDVAVRVFGGAKLPPTTLGEIWNIADEDNNGWLPKKGVAVAVRLIGWGQKGEKITPALLNKPGPLAVIDGINVVSQQSTGMSGMSIPKSPPPISFPVFTPQDKAKFQNMFVKSGPFNGLLSGEKARDIFVKSKLSNDQLLKIWNLADTQDRGALDATDFAIGMYFIQGAMTGKITFIPTSLPPGLYQQAGGASAPGSVAMHMTGNSASGSFSPINSAFNPQQTGQSVSALQPNYTGQPFKAPALPVRPSGAAPSNGHPHDWDVTVTEKASSDRFFDTLDTQKNGYIEGEVAVPFMLKSNLPGEVLAQVWDLADINNDGRLTRDGFAVAMHLIQKKLAGQAIPDTLPPSLVPPSARHTPFGDSPFQFQAPKQPEAPVQDLFSFDDTPPQSAVSSPLKPASTGSVQPNLPGATFNAAPPIPARKPQPEADPFSSATFKSPQSQDFFNDDDAHPVTSPPLHDQSAEIGNVKNQLTSTERSLAATRAERESVEQALASQASQLASMQTQLSSAKAAYETEMKLLTTFKERRTTQLSEIEKTRSELISAESDLSALRAEKAEIEGIFLRDKEEARDLHKRMVEAGQQAEALKVDVEKLKKEAKQQKGLLAIARKQLSTKETEKAKFEKEHEESVAEVTTISEEKQTVEKEIEEIDSFMASPPPSKSVASPALSSSLVFAAAQPLPTTPEIPSSPVSTGKSNNPFERLAMTSAQTAPLSPLAGVNNTILQSPVVSPPAVAEEVSQPSKAPVNPDDVFSFGHEEGDHELSYLKGDTSGAQEDGSHSPPDTPNETDFFMTPPTSAVNDTSPAVIAERFPSLGDISSQALDETVTTHVNGTVVPTSEAQKSTELEAKNAETDLGGPLKELEVEESDSEDESDDDDKPLAQVFAANGHGGQFPTSPPKVNNAAPVTTEASHPAPVAAPPPIGSFDDVFGSDEPHAISTDEPQGPFDVPVSSGTQPVMEEVQPAPHVASVAGVNEFDEALGKVTGSTLATPAAAAFSFDDAFEDSFDFASASKAAETTPSHPAVKQEQSRPSDLFDSLPWTTPAARAGASTSEMTDAQPAASTTANVSAFDSTFDDAFKTFDTIGEPKAEVLAADKSPPAATNESSASTPFSSTFTQPTPKQRTASPQMMDPVVTTPPRARSPPPRVSSPKLRVGSTSSKETPVDKPKEPRHSKLSIRLPFGKKKKQSEPAPQPAAQHLSPRVEEVNWTSGPGTPGNDDVESVKQLTAMGFSRAQAVEALEAQGYDVQKALNTLLGQ